MEKNKPAQPGAAQVPKQSAQQDHETTGSSAEPMQSQPERRKRTHRSTAAITVTDVCSPGPTLQSQRAAGASDGNVDANPRAKARAAAKRQPQNPLRQQGVREAFARLVAAIINTPCRHGTEQALR